MDKAESNEMQPDVQTPTVIHDAFISYSRKDKEFASALQRALEAYKPPRDLSVPQRRLNVFRDQSDFRGVDYYKSVDNHVKSSAKLIVLCSPHARASPYVNDEISRFVRAKGADNVLPVLVSGIPNNEAKSGQDAELAFPEALCEAMEMPLATSYVGLDLRKDKVNKGIFVGAWYKLLADLYGLERREVEQRDKKKQARARLVTIGIVSVVILALSVALVLTLVSRQEEVKQRKIAEEARKGEEEQRHIAEAQRDEAIRQSEIALSRQLAANSTYFLSKDVDLSLLLSVEATYKRDTLEARKVLFAGLTHLSNTERFIHFKRGQLIGVTFGSNQTPLGLTREAIHEGNGKIKGNVLQLWDLESGRKVGDKLEEQKSSLEPSFSKGNAVRFSPDGRYLGLATCQSWSEGRSGRDQDNTADCIRGQIDIYKVTERGLVMEQVVAHAAWIEELAFNLDSGIFAAASCQRVNTTLGDRCVESGVRLWSIRSGELTFPDIAKVPLEHFAVSSAGTIAASVKNSIRLLDKAVGRSRELHIPADADITALAFGSNARLLAAGTVDGRIFLLDMAESKPSRSPLYGHSGPVSNLSFSSDGDRLISLSADGTVLLHRVSQQHDLSYVLGYHHGKWATSVAFSPNGQFVISGGWDGKIKVWDYHQAKLNRAKLIGEISDGLRGPVKCVSFSPDGSVIASISQTVRADSSELRFWNAQTHKPTGEGIRAGGSRCRAFHPTLNHFVLERYNETLVLDWRTRKQIGPSLPCCSTWIDFTPNSGKLISAAYDGKIRVWDVTGEQPKDYVIASLGRRASTASLNPEGTRLAVAGTDGKAAGWVELLDVTTGSRLLNLRMSSLSPVVKVAFHPTDQILIIGSEDGAVFLWDLRHSEVIGEPLKSGNRMLNDISISPDGRAIAAAYKDGSVILWSLDLDKWRSVACRIANRTLTPDEWKRFVGDATDRARCLEPGPFPRSPR